VTGPLRFAAAALAVSLSAAPGHGQSPSTAPVDEYRVKAAVLYNLARFVSWPPERFENSSAPLSICVLGTDPFGSRLDDVVRGHRVGERGIVIQRINDVGPGCHVLFVSSSEQRRLPLLMGRLRGSGALTVAEFADFTQLGGMVGLITSGDQIRFDINLAATSAEQLKISARLLALAGKRRTEEAQP
jgi:hypothetical protein